MDETANRQVLDSVPDGVFTVDIDWRITNAISETGTKGCCHREIS